MHICIINFFIGYLKFKDVEPDDLFHVLTDTQHLLSILAYTQEEVDIELAAHVLVVKILF